MEKEQILLSIGAAETNSVRKVLVDPDLLIRDFLEDASRKWDLHVPCVLMDLDGQVLEEEGTFEQNRVLEGDSLVMAPDFLSEDLAAWHVKLHSGQPNALH